VSHPSSASVSPRGGGGPFAPFRCTTSPQLGQGASERPGPWKNWWPQAWHFVCCGAPLGIGCLLSALRPLSGSGGRLAWASKLPQCPHLTASPRRSLPQNGHSFIAASSRPPSSAEEATGAGTLTRAPHVSHWKTCPGDTETEATVPHRGQRTFTSRTLLPACDAREIGPVPHPVPVRSLLAPTVRLEWASWAVRASTS